MNFFQKVVVATKKLFTGKGNNIENLMAIGTFCVSLILNIVFGCLATAIIATVLAFIVYFTHCFVPMDIYHISESFSIRYPNYKKFKDNVFEYMYKPYSDFKLDVFYYAAVAIYIFFIVRFIFWIF